MIELKQKYQVSIFTNNQDLEPKPEILTTLINSFSYLGLLPMYFDELTPIGLVRKFELNSQNNEWKIRFASNRIDIEKNPTDYKGNNLGEISQFCNDTKIILEKLNQFFPRNSNRLAFVTKYFLDEKNDDFYKALYKRLFCTTKFYSENIPFEWNWRSASRLEKSISTKKEDVNFITSLFLVSGKMALADKINDFKRIDLEIDINTTPENMQYRFDHNDSINFLTNVQLWNQELTNEIIDFIG